MMYAASWFEIAEWLMIRVRLMLALCFCHACLTQLLYRHHVRLRKFLASKSVKKRGLFTAALSK